MDTQPTGTTEEPIDPQETVSDDTSQENDDAGQQKRIADKEQYLKDLDREIKEKEGQRKKAKTEETPDDVITWATMNSDELKMVHSEYQEELDFYKSHKIPITNDIRDRALREARGRKGLIKESTEGARQKATSSEAGTEMRKGAQPPQMPDTVKQLSKTMTPEKYQKYRDEFKARGLKV